MFNLNKYLDLHKGESCYIFGNGPSIKWFDLSVFSDYVGISTGSFPFHKDFSKTNVKYHALVEPWYYCPTFMQPFKVLKETKPLQIKQKELMSKYKELNSEYKNLDFFINVTNFPFATGANITYLHRKLITKNSKLYDIKKNHDPFQGSFHTTLCLAYLMGFSNIYLVGFDAWTIQPARTMRWFEYGQGEYINTSNFAIDFLNILNNQMDIYTISLDGESCNVKNINYEQYANKKPDFKENYQLLSKENFNMLDSVPQYSMTKNP